MLRMRLGKLQHILHPERRTCFSLSPAVALVAVSGSMEGAAGRVRGAESLQLSRGTRGYTRNPGSIGAINTANLAAIHQHTRVYSIPSRLASLASLPLTWPTPAAQ